MNAALGLLLLIQVNQPGSPVFSASPLDPPAHLVAFEFVAIPSTQYAGDSFDITVFAKDEFNNIFPYQGSALLTTTLGSYVNPNVAQFVNGICQRRIVVTLAGSLQIRCFTDSASGNSNLITVNTNEASRLVTILPGEHIAPGTPGGRSGLPNSHIAGDTFTCHVYLTDNWYNLIGLRDDSIYLGATDRFAQIPKAGQLFNGTASFTAGLRTAGRHRIYAGLGAGSGIETDSSASVTIAAGAYQNLLLIVPGETILPGDTASQSWQSPGKSGTPNVQFLRTQFPVKVHAVDGCWNQVVGSGDTVFLRSDFSFDFQPGAAELRDIALYGVQYNTPGPNQDIRVVNQRTGEESYRTRLTIRAVGNQLEILWPDTVRAGETTDIRVTVHDANDAPIVATLVQGSVVTGSGDILVPNLLTDTLGVTTFKFLATRARMAEQDSVRVTSGSADTVIGIYIDITDSAVMKGRVIAFPNPFGTEYERTEISYYLQNSSDVTLTIHDAFGNPVLTRQFARGENGARAGLNRRIYWDGRNEQGHRVASGIYVLSVIGEMFTGTTFKSSYRIGVLW